MGNQCKRGISTPCCGLEDDNNNDAVDQKDLQAFQRSDIAMIKLSKYDKFYRMAGQPLISIHIHEFIKDLEEMGTLIKWNSLTTSLQDKGKFQTE